MAGTIAADTLTHSTAGSLTTDYVVNGSAKAFVRFQDTMTVNSSLNVTSCADNGVGDYQVNFSNAFADANYNTQGTSSHNATRIIIVTGSTTTDCDVDSLTTSATRADGDFQNLTTYGDLA
jgi:hypothetical protein